LSSIVGSGEELAFARRARNNYCTEECNYSSPEVEIGGVDGDGGVDGAKVERKVSFSVSNIKRK
jgi:hypothetical protein